MSREPELGAGPEPAEGEAPELLGEQLEELGPGEAFEDLDLNGCLDWEYIP